MTDKKVLKIIKLDNVKARIITDHPTIMSDIYKYFSISAKEFWFKPKYKAGLWDGKITFVHKDGTFNIGLLKFVYNFVKRDDLNIQIDKELTKKTDTQKFDDITLSWLKEEWVPRDHQIKGALKAIHQRRGILEHATSSGKSLTIALIVMYYLITEEVDKCLILVPTLGLIEQMCTDLISYGVPEEWIGKFNGKIKNTEQPIIISTWQSMAKQKHITKKFTMLVCDEVHNLIGNVVRSVSEAAINASIRIGCTGSLPDHKCDQHQIISTLGPVIDVVTSRQLIDAGHASNIKIKILHLNHNEHVKKELKGCSYDMEKQYLEIYKPRNNVIKYITHKHMLKDHNMLILVNKLDHADELYNIMKSLESVNHVFIATGEVDVEQREHIRNFTNDNKRVVIVATSGVFSTGISIKRLHAVCFAAAGKSKIRTIQSIGRGLRLHKEKNMFLLYDISDSLKYSERHLEIRIGFYEKAEFDMDIKEINL